MSDTRPFPDIDPAAWTVLIRADDTEAITPENAAAYVGAELAPTAWQQLYNRHLIEDGQFSPLARTLRRWYRPQYGQR